MEFGALLEESISRIGTYVGSLYSNSSPRAAVYIAMYVCKCDILTSHTSRPVVLNETFVSSSHIQTENLMTTTNCFKF